MYKVYCDSFLLYTDTIKSLRIHNAKVDLEVNKTGAFSFTVKADHPYYNFINKMKSIITVYQDDFLLFRGRALNIEYGFHNEKIVKCEGDLAFLLDTIVRPYTFSGTITEYLNMLINSHNSQVESQHRFVVGKVTVTDSNDYITRSDEDYKSTWSLIEDKLINNLGGYISVRHEGDVHYIDYLSDFTLLSSQKVEFGKNLLSFKRAVKGENIATALIPLGAKLQDAEGNETSERLTIADVNGGLDYIYDEDAVALYGYIFATHTWDDVTVASNLLRKGQEYLATLIEPVNTIDLSAADLATLDSSITSFHIGTYVTVKSDPHGINQNFLVQKLSINLLNPSSNSLTLGGQVEATLTEQSMKVIQANVAGKGPKGDPGLPGEPGKDGKTSYFHVKYSVNADGNPMSETPDKYIGTYVDFTETDSDDYTKYTWTLFQGLPGEKGIPGENGEDGKTSYLHIAYATSADGSAGFSVSDSTNKTYIGQYTDFIEDDSTDYKKYKWTKIKGEAGATGKGISKITEHYQVSTSNTTAPTSWQETVPTMTATNKYLWNYETITYTDNTTADTLKRVIGVYGETGSPGAAGKGISSIVNYYLASASSSGVTTGTSGWTTTIQTISTSKKYLWNYEIITYTDNSKTTTTPAIIGVYGNTGEKGDPGAAGKDAAIQSNTAPTDTSYMWLDTSMTPAQMKWFNTETQAWEISNDMADVIYNLEQNLQASITTSETNILSTVSEQYYLKDETDNLVSSVSTAIEQTNNEVAIRFETFQTDIEALANGTDAEFEEIKKYIRFVDGKILLGEVGNALELEIANDRISFMQNSVEVAYFSNNKLYVTDGEYTNSLQLGNFAFVPRANGNLSFKKII